MSYDDEDYFDDEGTFAENPLAFLINSLVSDDPLGLDKVRVQRAEAEDAGTARDRVFDWDKAAKIIKERGAQSAAAGLIEDWGYTGGPILRDGKPVPQDDTYTYLASSWATPTLILDGDIREPCWIAQEEGDWNQYTYWPDSALEILGVPMPDSDEE